MFTYPREPFGSRVVMRSVQKGGVAAGSGKGDIIRAIIDGIRVRKKKTAILYTTAVCLYDDAL